MQSETRICQNCKKDFIIELDDFGFYEKIKVPPPTFCPECRFQRRLMFRNEYHLYKRKCELCKKTTLSTFSPDKQYIVYCPDCWWSDQWNPLDYGRKYDPNQPFLKQMDSLLHEVPLAALSTNYPTLINSDYVNETGYAKNCYLIFDADYCENVLYSTKLSNIKDSMDVHRGGESELCYESINCYKSSRIFFSEDINNCVNIFFSKNLVGCIDCFGCVNLRNKNHYIWNEPYSKEEYDKKTQLFKKEIMTREGIQNLLFKAEKFWLREPQKYMHGFQNVNVSGDYLHESKNAKNSFQARGLEDSRFCQFLKDGGVKNAYDYTIWGRNVELIYECMNVGDGVHNTKFCNICALGNTINTEYCIWCLDVMNLFGCSGLRKKKYCILNKQYTPEEFNSLRTRIIEDMQKNPYTDKKSRVWKYGEFFPYDISFYGYNETDAYTYFPVEKKEADNAGWKWHKDVPIKYAISMTSDKLPVTINQVSDDFLKEIIECVLCHKAYRFTNAELVFLRQFELPLPDKCFECRYKRRLARLNPCNLWHRQCQCFGEKSENSVYMNTAKHIHNNEHCLNEFETSYAPDRPEIVYCESCYNKEVY